MNKEQQVLISAISKEINQSLTHTLAKHHQFLMEMNVQEREKEKERGDRGNSSTASMNINRRLSGSIRNLTKHVDVSSTSFANLHKQLDNISDSNSKQTKANNEVMRQINKNIRGYSHVNKAVGEAVGALKRESDHRKRYLDDFSNTNNKRADEEEKLFSSFKQRMSATNTAMSKLSGWADTLSFSGILTAAKDDLQNAMRRSAIYNYDTMLDATVMGMSSTAFTELQSEFRTSIMATKGGLESWTESIKSTQLDMLSMSGGSMEEAAKNAAMVRDTVIQLGFSTNTVDSIVGDRSGGLVKTLSDLSIATGKTAEELNTFIKSNLTTEDVRDRLFTMDEKRRAAYVRNQTELMTRYVTLTGSLDKANDILIKQRELDSNPFKERMKRYAKLSMAASATGMDTATARDLMQIGMKNVANRSGSEQTRLLEIEGQLAERLSRMQGSGNYAMEALADSLKLQTGVGDVDFARTSAYAQMRQDNITQYSQDNARTYLDDSPLMQSIVTNVQKIRALFQQSLLLLSALAAGKVIQGLTRLPGFIGKTKDIIAGSGTVRDRLGRNMPKFAQGMFGEGSKARSGLSKFGKFAKSGLGIGGGLGIASFAVDQLWDADSAAEDKAKGLTTSALSGAGLGAAIGSIVPGIGTAIGAAVGAAGGLVYEAMKKDMVAQERFDLQHTNKRLENLNYVINSEREAYSIQVQELRKRAEFADDTQRLQAEKELQALDKEHKMRMQHLSKQLNQEEQVKQAIEQEMKAKTGFEKDLELFQLARWESSGKSGSLDVEVLGETTQDIKSALASYMQQDSAYFDEKVDGVSRWTNVMALADGNETAFGADNITDKKLLDIIHNTTKLKTLQQTVDMGLSSINQTTAYKGLNFGSASELAAHVGMDNFDPKSAASMEQLAIVISELQSQLKIKDDGLERALTLLNINNEELRSAISKGQKFDIQIYDKEGKEKPVISKRNHRQQ